MQNTIRLTPRLKKIYDIVPSCNCLADIGTDHAYLPVFLLENNICNTAIASDVAIGPLNRAKSTVELHKLSERVSLRLGSGLSTIDKNEADTVVIAGMGGLLIADILSDGLEKIKNTKIIIQPMSSVPDLRLHLYKSGFCIEKEHLVKELDKLYIIMEISYTGENYTYDDIDIYFGRYFVDNKPELYSLYLEQQIKKYDTIIKGLLNAENDNSKEKLKKTKLFFDKLITLKEDL